MQCLKLKLIIAGALSTVAVSASAEEYNRLVTEQSRIGFVYRQMNAPTDGRFKRFSGDVRFDPARPATAKARLDIDVTSIEVGALDAAEEVGGKLWFNTKEFPRAQFVSIAVTPVGDGRFDVRGNLTIKGRTREINVPVTFKQEGNNAALKGSFVIKRADFGIGEDFWTDYDVVANEVQVKFELLVAATRKGK